jgi:adenosylcobinamide-phosphate synthase
MRPTHLIAAICLLDWMAGDPEWLPHPVRLIGRCTQLGESLLRTPQQSPRQQLVAGAALTAGVVGLSWFAGEQAIVWTGWPAEIALGWTCLAARNLCDESRAVLQALDQNDLPHARQRLARIVGRDTQTLSATEIHRAVIETLAESACDGIVAPLFYLAIGGVPLALAYKAVNTLDSMIGHADERYFYFGKAAARLDDLANYIPARLTALSISAASGRRVLAALRTWRRDGGKHKSPNAGQPESAMAGSLGARLGGDNTYAGEIVQSTILGAEFEPPTLQQAKKALRIVVAVSILCAAASILALRQVGFVNTKA